MGGEDDIQTKSKVRVREADPRRIPKGENSGTESQQEERARVSTGLENNRVAPG